MEGIQTETINYPMKRVRSLAIVRDLIEVGQTGSDVAFHTVYSVTQLGFSVARSSFSTPAELMDKWFGVSRLSNAIRSVHTTVEAAEVVALSVLLAVRTVTALSLTVADTTLELTGVPRGDKLVQNLKMFLPRRVTEYTPALELIAKLCYMGFNPVFQAMNFSCARKYIIQYAVLQQAHRLPIDSIPHTPKLSDQPDFILKDLVRWMSYSAAVYGNYVFHFMDMIYAAKLRKFESDALAALVPGVSSKDIIKKNDRILGIFSSGYMLVADHSRSAIVLVIRGSLDMNDVVTILTCSSTPLGVPVEGLREGDRCEGHDGFRQAANFLDKSIRDAVREALDLYEGRYRLILCGHSLGGGVATMLTLKWANVFPGIRCISLSAPCTLSLEAARACSDLVTSVVIGDDIVSRLSKGSVYDLRNVLLKLHRERDNKESNSTDETELLNFLRQKYSGQEESVLLTDRNSDNSDKEGQTTVDNMSLASSSSPDNSPYSDDSIDHRGSEDSGGWDQFIDLYGGVQEQEEWNILDTVSSGNCQVPAPSMGLQKIPAVVEDEDCLRELMKSIRTKTMDSDKLYPAGQIVHLIDRTEWESALVKEEAQSQVAVSEDSEFVAYIADPLQFSEIYLSGTMFSAHWPNCALMKLKRLFPEADADAAIIDEANKKQ